jgi:hypothetical protein
MSAAVFTLHTTHARAIVANPTPRQSTFLRRLAWCALKEERGERVVQSRLPRPAPPAQIPGAPALKPQPMINTRLPRPAPPAGPGGDGPRAA